MILHFLHQSEGFATLHGILLGMHPGPSTVLPVILTLFLALVSGAAEAAMAMSNSVFQGFTRHIGRQVDIDKQAFAQASTCLSWFYKASKKTPPPAVQGISRSLTAQMEPERDCPRLYPDGMDAARDDFSRTQTLLSVSLTVYEFALVADRNDDQAYSSTELHDLFHALSLVFDTTEPRLSPLATLTARFDHWHRARNLDEVMQGMSTLYERGYRVTASDRAELDRIMK
jgi:hypothetical protein